MSRNKSKLKVEKWRKPPWLGPSIGLWGTRGSHMSQSTPPIHSCKILSPTERSEVPAPGACGAPAGKPSCYSITSGEWAVLGFITLYAVELCMSIKHEPSPSQVIISMPRSQASYRILPSTFHHCCLL